MKMVALGEVTLRVRSWNPARTAPDKILTYIDLSAVDNQTKTIGTVQEIAGAEAPSRARQLVASGDILVSTVRPNLNGVARVSSDLDGATASTGFCVLRVDPTKLDRNYLYHWVTGARFVDDMIRKATGASYPAVSDRIIGESQIPLPPLPEQRRIAGILDQADALRRLRRQSLSRLSNLGQAIFYEMFGDVRINDRNWNDGVTLQECAEVVSGITKGRKLNGQSTRAIPYMTVATVQDGYLNLDNVKSIEATDREIERYRLLPSDILLTEGGDPDKLGRGTMWSGQLPECIHQNHVFRVRVRDKRLTPTFATWLIGSSRGKSYFFRAAKQTTGIASINSTQLKMFPLILPPIELQGEFAERLKLLEMKRKSVDAAIEQTASLFASLQHRAFRGEL